MGTLAAALAVFGLVAVAVIAVCVAADRAGARALRERDAGRAYELQVATRRLEAEERREERAMAAYAISAAMGTVQAQAAAMARNAEATTLALTDAVGRLGDNDRAAIDALHTQGIVQHYTAMLRDGSGASDKERDFARQLEAWNRARLGAGRGRGK